MAFTEKYVTDSGTEPWVTNSAGNPSSLATAFSSAAAGERVNIKNGSYSSGAVTVTNAGATENPIVFRGYNSTIGDLEGGARDNGNAWEPLTITNFPTITFSGTLTTSGNNIYRNLEITATHNGTTLSCSGTQNVVHECKVANTHATGGSSICIATGTSYTSIVNCDVQITSTNTAAVCINNGRGKVLNCRIWGAGTTGADGMTLDTFGWAVGCLIFDVRYAADLKGLNSALIGCTIENVDTAVNLNNNAAFLVANNVAYTMSAYFLRGTNAGNAIIIKNAAGSHTSGRDDSGLGEITEIDSIALSADPFTNASTGDYSLNNTAGGGAACREVAIWPFGDVGAFRHEDPAGGGGLLVHPGMSGGTRG